MMLLCGQINPTIQTIDCIYKHTDISDVFKNIVAEGMSMGRQLTADCDSNLDLASGLILDFSRFSELERFTSQCVCLVCPSTVDVQTNL